MPFPSGSLLLVDFTVRIKGTGEIFDTTNADIAAKNNLDTASGPRLVSINDLAFPVLSGFEEVLAQSEEDKELEVEVPPDKAFGERDAGKIRMVPLRKFGDDIGKIAVGDSVTIDDKTGIVRFIGSGRVQMDYNHRYAGRTIIYNATVRKRLESNDDIIAEILADIFPERENSDPRFTFDVTDREVTIDIPRDFFRADDLPNIKSTIQRNIIKFADDIFTVTFVERYHKGGRPPEVVGGDTDQDSAVEAEEETQDAKETIRITTTVVDLESTIPVPIKLSILTGTQTEEMVETELTIPLHLNLKLSAMPPDEEPEPEPASDADGEELQSDAEPPQEEQTVEPKPASDADGEELQSDAEPPQEERTAEPKPEPAP